MLWIRIALLATFLFPAVALADEEPVDQTDGRLTVDRIYADREFTTRSAPVTAWLGDGDRYTTLEDSETAESGSDLVVWDTVTGEREVLVTADQLAPPNGDPLDVSSYQWSEDLTKLLIFTNTERVWRRNTRGDYWLLDRTTGDLRQIGASFPESTLMFAKLSPTGEAVAFVQAHDLWIEWLDDRGLQRLTENGSATLINGTFDWVHEEELRLRDGFRFSPSGDAIAFWQLDASAVRDYVLVDTVSTLYPTLTHFPYPKVGEDNASARIGVIDLATTDITWMEVTTTATSGYLARMQWLGDPAEVMVQHINRAQNHLTVFICSPTDGACRSILEERDEAWVNVHSDPAVTPDQQHFTWLSERDGWNHLYLAHRDGASPTLLTPGDFDVVDLVAVTDTTAFFTASPDNATQRFLHAVALDGDGPVRRVTPSDQPGTHTYTVAPSGAAAIHTWSASDRAPRISVVALPSHEERRVLEDNAEVQAAIDVLDPAPREFFQLEIADEVVLDGWMRRPPGFDPTKRYPVLFYVYGEPSGLTVRDAWGRDGDLWHRLLAHEGYVVMSVDNRGTPAPRGRAWRKAMYGAVGVLGSADQAAAARAAIERWPWVDPERIGVWGWSGGGSMTLNLMFRSSELYRVGLSVAPVPDQRLYDTIYQERFSGLLPEFADGYEQGSPITFAEGLEGDLLIVHGTGDDNVHYQGTERLIDELVRLDKAFTMMAYPNRSHGIHEGEGTTLHLRRLLHRFLTEHLPAGPRERDQ
jgi:dipeptidyl-peptidase-4